MNVKLCSDRKEFSRSNIPPIYFALLFILSIFWVGTLLRIGARSIAGTSQSYVSVYRTSARTVDGLKVQPEGSVQSHRLDINRATAAQLQLLPRIGPVLANRIIEDRELQGAFGSVEELDRVKGIGPKTIQRIRRYCKVID